MLLQCVGYAADLVRPEAERRAVTVAVDVPETDTGSLDAIEVHQVLLNLGTNAVQATAAGGTVRMTARRHDGTRQSSPSNPGPGSRRG